MPHPATLSSRAPSVGKPRTSAPQTTALALVCRPPRRARHPSTLLGAHRVADAYDMPDIQAVRRTIKQLRDVPANTTGAGQDVLLLISDYLVEVSQKDGPVHWFCPKATQLTIDCATFLLRLHAYESSSIQTWRSLLTRCLRGCCDCVRGLEEAKVTSRHTQVWIQSQHVRCLTRK